MTQGYLQADLLNAATADETTSPWVDVRGRTAVVFYVEGLGTTSGGVVTLEESLPAPSGTWAATAASIGTVNATAVSGGVQIATHVSGAYAFVRARVSTAITGGGSVSARVVAA